MNKWTPYLVLIAGVALHLLFTVKGIETSSLSFLLGGLTAGTMVAVSAKLKLDEQAAKHELFIDTLYSEIAELAEMEAQSAALSRRGMNIEGYDATNRE